MVSWIVFVISSDIVDCFIIGKIPINPKAYWTRRQHKQTISEFGHKVLILYIQQGGYAYIFKKIDSIGIYN